MKETMEKKDNQWDENASDAVSRTTRGIGWIMVLVWILGITGYGLWLMATSSQGLMEKVLIFGGLAGVGLLFVSVLIDRIRRYKTDRYKEVQK